MKEKVSFRESKLANSKFFKYVEKTMKIYNSHEMSVYAGYVTLYILMAMIPLFMLIFIIINRIPALSSQGFIDLLLELVPDITEIQNAITELLHNIVNESNTFVASVSAVTTLWSASTGVSAIQSGLNHIHEQHRSTINGKPMALLFTVIFILFIPTVMIFQLLRAPLMSAAAMIFTRLKATRLLNIIQQILSYYSIIILPLMGLIIMLTYTYLPYGKRTMKSQLPGTIFTCVGAIGFTYGFSFFMNSFWQKSSLYGSLAAIFLTAMWLNILIIILLYGACLNEAINPCCHSSEASDTD